MSTALDPRRAAALADEVEARAFVDLYAAAPAALHERLGLRTVVVAGATALLAPGLPASMFNRVIGLGNERRADEADLNAVAALYRDAGVSAWWLHWNPHSEPAGFERAIAAHGFVPAARSRWAKMLRGVAPLELPPTTLQLAAPTSAEQWQRACVCATQAFGMPPLMVDWLGALWQRPRWHGLVVADAGVPVGAACLYVEGATGWLGMGSVVASHRRRGGQLHALAQRIATAARLGCTHVVTETGEPIGDEPNPSLANIYRAGFERVASRLNFEAAAAR